MNAIRKCAILFLAFLLPTLGWAQQKQQNIPHIAYVYPAGGQMGATFQITVGGQFLASVSNAYVSGPGVQAQVMEYNRPLPQQQFKDLQDELKQLQEKRKASGGVSSGTNAWTDADTRRMTEIRDKILKNPPNRKANPAMEETITLKISIATNSEPGEREIRLKAPNGVSNPFVFCVGELPEFSKPLSKTANPDLDRFLQKLGAKPASPGTPKFEARVNLPATLNGQIMPGGMDRYRFEARKGQQLVISAGARALIPYLADAVPGWFEARLTIFDAKGNELASDERFHFRPDPVIHFAVPQDGDYAVEIHDSIFRGREDFVYRLTLGELPFVTSIFPLGGPVDGKTDFELTGWNLPIYTLTVDNTGKPPGMYSISITNHGRFSNLLPFALDNLPECSEREPNNSPETAQAVTLPVIINGRMDKPGDEDVYRFSGRAGERIVAEVYARRLDSPLDSTLTLTDAAGKQLAFNDDYDDKGSGLETHHADSYLTATLPADGNYYLRIADAQQNGGPDYAYRLRLSAPRPDFALRVSPSGLNLRAGLSVPFTVYALRKDGFTNAIDLRLKSAPAGFSITGARVPENQDQTMVTLKGPAQPEPEPVKLELQGRAVIGGCEVTHAAVPAEDLMQAFAYWHLVPSRAFEVAVAGNPRPFASNDFKILSATPVKISAGGTAFISISTPSGAFANRFDLELNSAPEGITLEKISPSDKGVEMLLRCDAATAKPGLQGNLIVNVIPKTPATNQPPKARGNQPRKPVGVLPAIPFQISPE